MLLPPGTAGGKLNDDSPSEVRSESEITAFADTATVML